MQFSGPAIVTATRPYGETAVIAHLLTEEAGLIAAYVAGGKGRQLRPVLIPGNEVAAELRARNAGGLLFARLELITSRAPWLSEPLPAAAIGWASALTTTALAERHAYPRLYSALSALLDAICHAPSARGWLPGLLAYETLLLRELGYGEYALEPQANIHDLLADFTALGQALSRYLLADSSRDVMAARSALGGRLERIMA